MDMTKSYIYQIYESRSIFTTELCVECGQEYQFRWTNVLSKDDDFG